MSVILDYSFGNMAPEWKTCNYKDSVEMDKIISIGGDIKGMTRKYCSAQVLHAGIILIQIIISFDLQKYPVLLPQTLSSVLSNLSDLQNLNT